MANDLHPLLGALGLCRKAGKLHRRDTLASKPRAEHYGHHGSDVCVGCDFRSRAHLEQPHVSSIGH